MGNSTQLSLTGEEAINNAIQMLQAIDDESGEKHVEITISDAASKDEEEVKEYSESTAKTKENYQQGRIQAGTSHHYTLYALAQLTENGGRVPGNEVVDAVTEYNPTSVRPALTQLHKRSLVDRKKVNTDNSHYEYKVTNWGEKILNELGKPE